MINHHREIDSLRSRNMSSNEMNRDRDRDANYHRGTGAPLRFHQHVHSYDAELNRMNQSQRNQGSAHPTRFQGYSYYK